MKVLLWILRIAVGGLFIVSGLIKANDPLGFSYKLDDYYEVFGEYWLLQFFDNPIFYQTALITSMFICVFEIVLGVALIIGAKARKVNWLLLVMIIMFTFLTGFSAITDKVTDCGCFGDAIKLTPWESFTKDIVLLVLIGILFYYRKKIKPSFSNPKISNSVFAGTTLTALIFTIMAYNHLPYKDFRPYAVSNNVCELKKSIPDKMKHSYVLKNKASGENKVFDKFPDNYEENWEFVEMISEVLEKGVESKIQNFNLSDENGNNYTDEFLAEEGYRFLLIAYNIGKTRRGPIEKINTFQQASENAGIPFYGVSASGDDDIEVFRHEHGTAFPFLSSDETELKTIIRSNPGLVLMKGCIIKGKWHWRDIPEFASVEKNYLKE